MSPLYYHIVKSFVGPHSTALTDVARAFRVSDIVSGSDQVFEVPNQFRPLSWNDLTAIIKTLVITNRADTAYTPYGVDDPSEITMKVNIRKVWGELKVVNLQDAPLNLIIWELKAKELYTGFDFENDWWITQNCMSGSIGDAITIPGSTIEASGDAYGYSPFMFPRLMQYFKVRKLKKFRLAPGGCGTYSYKYKGFVIGVDQVQEWWNAAQTEFNQFPKGCRIFMFQSFGDPCVMDKATPDDTIQLAPAGPHMYGVNHDHWVKWDIGDTAGITKAIYDKARVDLAGYTNARHIADTDVDAEAFNNAA